ncbi:MAG: mechanosensitive ion channel family protein, partial [Kiritimatiellae bacterium]|nr:mechanosensitive ion channel family protein [Kiritimatiellia bacterium]
SSRHGSSWSSNLRRTKTSVVQGYFWDTTLAVALAAQETIKEVLDQHEGMHPDLPPRVFFNEFNDASLNILVLYWFHPPDYWAYMAFSEKFNMEVLRRFNEEGIEFAFPTQTLYLAGDVKRPLELKR